MVFCSFPCIYLLAAEKNFEKREFENFGSKYWKYFNYLDLNSFLNRFLNREIGEIIAEQSCMFAFMY